MKKIANEISNIAKHMMHYNCEHTINCGECYFYVSNGKTKTCEMLKLFRKAYELEKTIDKYSRTLKELLTD